jgi:hypothetical protein
VRRALAPLAAALVLGALCGTARANVLPPLPPLSPTPQLGWEANGPVTAIANDRASGMTSAGANCVYRDDPGLYHLVIDTSAFGLDACVNLIVAAGQLRLHQASATG